LAARLKAQPRDASGWIRLIRSRMVLGDPEAARSALEDSLSAFADSPPAQAKLRAAAMSMGVPGT
jgi:cytochrome c-type biogenesis protein CcmH